MIFDFCHCQYLHIEVDIYKFLLNNIFFRDHPIARVHAIDKIIYTSFYLKKGNLVWCFQLFLVSQKNEKRLKAISKKNDNVLCCYSKYYQVLSYELICKWQAKEVSFHLQEVSDKTNKLCSEKLFGWKIVDVRE